VYHDVVPLLKNKYADKVNVVFRHQVQPWHPSSTLGISYHTPNLHSIRELGEGEKLINEGGTYIAHEAALAVERVSPGLFWEFSAVSGLRFGWGSGDRDGNGALICGGAGAV
jgi:hypothetical protein